MIPDPIEIMEARQEELMHNWIIAQKNVPEGSFRCPYCNKINSYEPIQSGASPDSPIMCYDCLPDDLKIMYDQFENDLMQK